MKKIYWLVLGLSFNAFSATPESLKINVYQVSVSLSTDCTDPQTIFSSNTGVEKDFMKGPTLGSGSLADGEYHCVMITMDDFIKYKPDSSTGSCSAGFEYTRDLCRTIASSGGVDIYSTTDLLEGTTFSDNTECQGTSSNPVSGGVKNKVTLYLRTNALGDGDINFDNVNSWKKGITPIGGAGGGLPTSAQPNGIQLANPFVVSGSKVGVFYMDFTNKIVGSGGECDVEPPKFGFRDP